MVRSWGARQKSGAELREGNRRPRRPQKSPADGRAGKGIRAAIQAWGGVIKGEAMRLRRRRLQPRAAAAPNKGTGPGTFDVGAGPAQTCDFSEVQFNTHSPSNPDVLDRPKSARVLFTKVIDAERGVPGT